MLTELCAELHNYFIPDYHNVDKYVHVGSFTIENGAIQGLQSLKPNQYYRIVGSLFNDGVHKNTAQDVLQDETFDGAIWEMRVPPDVVTLANEIEQWALDNAATLASPFQSESFGGYSYSLRSGASAAGSAGGGLTWQVQFDSRLKPYRRLTVL